MHRYIARRLLLVPLVLFLVSLVIFVLIHALPGDIALVILAGGGDAGMVSEEALAALREKLGTDQPLWVQYGAWMGGLLTLNPGLSLWTGEPVAGEVLTKLLVTLQLALMAIAVSWLIALPLGVLSALRQDTWIDYIFRVLSIGGLVMPEFWTGVLIILFLSTWFGWVPPLGYARFIDDPMRNLSQLLWPVLALGYRLAALLSRMIRSSLLEVVREDYIRTAWAKGLREQVITYRHAMKNAILPVVTVSGNHIGYLLGGAVVMELIFNLPGLGRLLVDSVFHRDYPVVQIIVLAMALVFMLVNLAVDLLYGWLDPRIRYS
ncbi:MAG: ABC transporter permease [Chloroflexi bacterium]|nr:ABC transporter permease [Chloroflexota bacterium]